MLEPEQSTPSGLRRHRFMGRSIDLPAELTQAQLHGRACIRCAAEYQRMRPVEAWSELSSQLFECVEAIACVVRRGPIRHVDSQESGCRTRVSAPPHH